MWKQRDDLWFSLTMGQSESIKKELPSQADQIFGTIFGQCIGDAIGLLTEFMTKAEAEKVFNVRPITLSFNVVLNSFRIILGDGLVVRSLPRRVLVYI